MTIIKVRKLRKQFKEKKNIVKAVNNISFDIKKGEIFGLLGPNGAGKTTTINILTGLINKDSGTVKLFNKNLENDWEYIKNRTNVSTAYYPLSDVLTVHQNLLIYAKIFNIKNPRDKIKDLLEKFELTRLANRQVVKLSSGEKTRAALCKGLINDPEILFLDECTVGLDPDIAQKTRAIIKELQKKHNTTILFTSHYMYEVEELCDRIAFMSNGKIFRIDTAQNLKNIIDKQIVEIIVRKKHKDLLELLEERGLNIILSEKGKIHFEITRSDDKVYKVLNRIFSSGFKLDHLNIKRPTLDDIFIKIARDKK